MDIRVVFLTFQDMVACFVDDALHDHLVSERRVDVDGAIPVVITLLILLPPRHRESDGDGIVLRIQPYDQRLVYLRTRMLELEWDGKANISLSN